MIYTLARTKNLELLENVPLGRLSMEDIIWYWVDFDSANNHEIELLSTYFKFHDLAIEDCLEHLERPKVDYYGTYNFFVLHSIDSNTLEPIELDLFVGDNYVVSFHKSTLKEIESTRQKILSSVNAKKDDHIYVAYLIFDKIVDYYFPIVYRIEDSLSEIDIKSRDRRIYDLIDQVFEIRTDLLKLRHTINSMKELLYRILNSEHLQGFRDNKRHFNDIYDHLLRLSDIVESNREVTADVRDNYLSINSHKMNKIMTILTVITSVFIPLTFIVGIYGMNFDYMPELRWQYGYFYVLGLMAFIGMSMLLWFKRKGWFDIKK
ncbi:MAG: magnesium/cobalt transporter CorA [Clostridia bacterium]|nr:magnesium/cobalt transporter CorA [Clostridia bacterium]